jgi:CRP-like cAMP-binding protein
MMAKALLDTRINPLLRRLHAATDLTDAECDALMAAFHAPRRIGAGRPIAQQGERPNRLHILTEGWAARSKLLANGHRHLPMLLLPGDLCDVDALHVQRLDYAVTALTTCEVVAIDREALLAVVREHPAVGDALAWLTFRENAILAESLASHGRRSAQEHLAHLLCELRVRLAAVGAADAHGYPLPITQEALADATGLTSVHVNRTLQALRTSGMITLCNHRVTIHDPDALTATAGFDAGYLHPDGMRPRPAA